LGSQLKGGSRDLIGFDNVDAISADYIFWISSGMANSPFRAFVIDGLPADEVSDDLKLTLYISGY
jgi:hypothetical protein